MNQARNAAIVGLYEWPKRVDPDVSAMEIKALSISRALADAGLKWSDVDGIYDANDGDGGGGLGLAPYLGFHPRIIDTTSVAGSSYEFQVARALRDIAAGRVNVAVLSYGSKAASQRIPIGTGGPRSAGNWQANMENPYGSTLISNYAMVAMRHMHEYGTKSEQLAEIAVTTRAHAMRNPQAVQAMQDLQFMNIREITVDDVMESRVIADPLHLLECCMVSDGGGALVLASPEIARTTKKKPVWVIGCGEAIQYRRNGGDITVSAAAQSAPRAFAEAQVTPDEIDIAMIYDSFTITVAMLLEDVGFCKKGEVGDFVSGQNLRWDRPGLTLNTDGGGLSSNHPGMRGLFLLLEATRQLRGESTSQVEGAKLALAHGNGGLLGGTHTGGTVVLAAD
ncbi:MAG: thiolase domain-containing protein [Chloroflexi bacterium]|nr:thiolase domain-containing protein [Chloroflexota bacterium]